MNILILCERIGLVYAVGQRYYQNKTKLRYNFGSVYNHSRSFAVSFCCCCFCIERLSKNFPHINSWETKFDIAVH